MREAVLHQRWSRKRAANVTALSASVKATRQTAVTAGTNIASFLHSMQRFEHDFFSALGWHKLSPMCPYVPPHHRQLLTAAKQPLMLQDFSRRRTGPLVITKLLC